MIESMQSFLLKHKFSVLFTVIILLSIGLRFNQLGRIPHGMTWDEAAIGYNGHAIFTTRRDEWLEFLPTSFQSFGDYKAPLAIYANGFFTALFGMKLWAVRLPFALAGVMAVIGLVLWVKELLGQDQALVAGFIMTLSPWHLHFSRAGFEAGLALTFFIWALYFFWRFLAVEKKRAWWWLPLSGVSAVSAVYSYHSAKLVVPIVFLCLLIWQRKKLWQRRGLSLLVAGLVGGLLIPLVLDSVNGPGLTRLGTAVFDELSGLVLLKTVIQQWLLHLSPQFLLGGATTTLRHGGGQFGYLLLTTFFLNLVAVICGIFFRKNFKQKELKALLVVVVILVIGLLPAAIGEEVPHSNRALLALPAFVIGAGLGLKALLRSVEKLKANSQIKDDDGQKNLLVKSVFGTLLLLHGLFFVKYLNYYYHSFAPASAEAFKDGYLEAFTYVSSYEEEVNKILFTSDYGQPYIYALFVRQTNPIWYQGGSLIKYEFSDEINVGDLVRENAIIVASQDDEIKPGWADHLVYGSDGEVRFKIYLPDELKAKLKKDELKKGELKKDELKKESQ